MKSDVFYLFDLKVEVIKGSKGIVCNHCVGEAFEVQGEDIVFKRSKKFSLYALSALLPLLPAKQRETDIHDWMTTDTNIACPDPNCGGIFRITRLRKRKFRHSEVTKI